MGSRPDEEDGVEPASPAEQLRGFIHHFLSRVLAINDPDDWRHRLMLREMLHPTSASDVLVREAIRPKFERLKGILRRFCPEADERRLHALAFSVIGQCLHYKMARPIAERLIGGRGVRGARPGFPDRPYHVVLPGGAGLVAPAERGGRDGGPDRGARPTS